MLSRKAWTFLTLMSVHVTFVAGCYGGSAMSTSGASATLIDSTAQLIGGENATGEVGDFLLANDRIRVIVQNQRPAGVPGIAGYGGNLVDADRLRLPGNTGEDRLGGVVTLLNGAHTVKPERVFILQDGSATGEAIVRVEGPTAPLPGISPAQHGAAAGLATTLDRGADPALYVKTDYILRAGTNYIEVRSTLLNRGKQEQRVSVGDLIERGSTEPFVSGGRGFMLPATDTQVATLIFEADRVSYGYHVGPRRVFDRGAYKIVNVPAALLFSYGRTLGVVQLFESLKDLLAPAANSPALLPVPAGQSADFTRYVIVGAGDAGGIFEAISYIARKEPGFVSGQVGIAGEDTPIAGADVAVFSKNRPIAHFRTDANGQFHGALPAGNYLIGASAAGHPFDDGDNPSMQALKVVAGAATATKLSLPPGGQLRIFMRDMSARLGEDGAPLQPLETINQALSGRVIVTPLTGTLDDAVRLNGFHSYPFRVPGSGMQLLITNVRGEAPITLRPGQYALRAYHGPFYSMAALTADIQAGRRIDKVFELARVIEPEGHIIAEFNARTARGDGHLSVAGNLSEALAEGVDLFVGTDSGRRTPLLPALLALDAENGTPTVTLPFSNRLAVGTGESVDTTGYGTFSAWPLTGSETVATGDARSFYLPERLLELMREALSGAGRSALTAAGVTPEPFLQVEWPFGAPSEPGSILNAYLDSMDATVDWDTGALFSGQAALPRAPQGLSATGELWITGAQQTFTGLQVFYDDEDTLHLAMNAWFTLLNLGYNNPGAARGKLPALVAMASGSGALYRNVPAGKPRNYVPAPISMSEFRVTDDNGHLGALGKVNEVLRTGKNLISNAPMIDIQVAPAGAPEKAVGMGTLLAAGGVTQTVVTVRVSSPCWAPIESVRLYANSTVTEPAVVTGVLQNAVAPAATLALNPQIVNAQTGQPDPDACYQTSAVQNGTGVGRYEAEVSHTLTLETDSWIVAKVSGSGFIPAITTGRGPLRPLALTNPVFVDAMGDSSFTAPCPGPNCPNQGPTRLGWRE
jgi:hypothetical protein